MPVVNWKTAPSFEVYIGRHVPDGPSHVPPEACVYGNPIILHDVDDPVERAECIGKYEKWLLAPEQRALVERAKRELPGKVLACWCKPKDCHGDVLSRVANETKEETEAKRVELGV